MFYVRPSNVWSPFKSQTCHLVQYYDKQHVRLSYYILQFSWLQKSNFNWTLHLAISLQCCDLLSRVLFNASNLYKLIGCLLLLWFELEKLNLKSIFWYKLWNNWQTLTSRCKFFCVLKNLSKLTLWVSFAVTHNLKITFFCLR